MPACGLASATCLTRRPPIVGESGRGGNTFPGLYDALGRYWFVGVSVAFS